MFDLEGHPVTLSSLLAAGSILRLNHPLCGPSLGCGHGSHGGLPGLAESLDAFWTYVALVGAFNTSFLLDVSLLSQLNFKSVFTILNG